MKLLKNLNAEDGGDAPPLTGIMHGVHQEMGKAGSGHFRCFRLTRSALVCVAPGGSAVSIPFTEIAALVGKFEPKFVAPK